MKKNAVGKSLVALSNGKAVLPPMRLTARLIDRPIRPMFAEGFRNEVQVTNIVMSVEQDCAPSMAAMFGSSLALAISDIFDGPIAGVEVGRVNGEYVLNPTVEQAQQTDIELTVAGTKTSH